MSKEAYPVRWTGLLAVVTLPEHIDGSNAGQVREQLLLTINRGAAVLIADLAATVSCDYSGADAVARAYQRAVASGTQLRLVVPADVVRRVLGLSALDRAVPVYPTLEGAIAAGAERRAVPGEPGTAVIISAAAEVADMARAGATDHTDRTRELLGWVVDSIFDVGVSLQAATGLPGDVAGPRITEAVGRLDDVVWRIRHHMLAPSVQGAQPGPASRPQPDADERENEAAKRTAQLRQRMVRAAYELQHAAVDAAARLEQQAPLLPQPRRVDYRTEIKRFRALADQARKIAERWELA